MGVVPLTRDNTFWRRAGDTEYLNRGDSPQCVTQQQNHSGSSLHGIRGHKKNNGSAEVTRMTKMEGHNSFQIQKCLMALKCYFNGDHMLTFKHNSTALLNMVVFIFFIYFVYFFLPNPT